MARGIGGGFIGVILVAIVAVLWNSYSNGGLIRALGGATSGELAAEAAKHPGPPGPAGPPGNPGPPGAGSVVSLIAQGPADFDKSGPIPGSEAYPLCTLSKIILPRYVVHRDRSCELAAGAAHGDPWQIVVNGAVCGVTCFTVGANK
jgi:hypothetical protein